MLKSTQETEFVDMFPSGHRAPDVLQTLWRWKPLPILGALLGLIGGYLYFSRQPSRYLSTALVQVLYPGADSAGIDTLTSADSIRGKSRLDESMIIKSVKVVDFAIEKGRLDTNPYFAGKSASEIRDWILTPSRLMVQPAGRDSNSAMIEIRFESNDAAISQAVVDSIIAGYDAYLGNAYRKFGREVVEMVTQAQDSLKSSYAEIADRNTRFRENAPMVWLGEEGKNHFAENCVQIQKEINSLEIEIGKIQSLVKYVLDEQSKGRPAETILPMLATDAHLRTSVLTQGVDLPGGGDPAVAIGAGSEDRRTALVDLRMKEKELLDTVGEGHPTVAAIRRRIDLISEHVATIEEGMPLVEDSELSEPRVALRRLDWWKTTLQDRLAALELQRSSLLNLAERNEAESKKLGKYLNEYKIINSELAAAQSLLEGVTGTLNRMQILPQDKSPSLETLTPPVIGAFSGPKLTPYLIEGAALGAVLMSLLAIALDFADRGFRNPDEIHGYLGLPVVGHVPFIRFDKSSKLPAATVAIKNGFCSEAFRQIRTGLFYSDSTTPSRIIQVTSPAPGDGKSTISTNLAISIAQSGRRVLLIDADMRRPRIAKLFGLHGDSGLAEVIHNKVEFAEAIHSTEIENLHVLASSKPSKNPSELLSSSNFAMLLETLRDKYDFIVVDTPPVLAVSDPCTVAAVVDGVLLAVRLRRNAKPLARQASQLLDNVGARKVGVIVNGVSKRGGYEYYYNQYGYEEVASQ